jgi:hypothetical protein
MEVSELREAMRRIEAKIYSKENTFLKMFGPSNSVALESLTFTSDYCIFTVMTRDGKVEKNQTTLELAFKWVERN